MDGENDRKIREFAYRELKNGKSPDELFTIALSSGVSREVATREFEVMSHAPQFAFAADALADFIHKQSRASASTTPRFWDPVGEEITQNTFHGVRYELEAKGKEMVKNPHLPRRNLALLSSPLIIALATFAFEPGLLRWLASLGGGDGLALLFVLLIPPTIYVHRVFRLQRDIIKLLIANQQGWHYCPAESHERWIRFADVYPEVFAKGNKDQNVQDEFWGTVKYSAKTVDFWSAIFEYAIETHSEKGRTNRQVKHANVFALRLPKALKADFRLEPAGITTRVRRFFRRQTISTESQSFNRNFAVFWADRQIEDELEIMRILSPSVQVRLLDIMERFGRFTLIFRKGTVVIAFPGRLLKRMRTNFFRQVAVDTRDKDAITDRLTSVLTVSADIVRFLD